ncbi:p285L [African swine fever virus]|uniref:p285L n=1 Tax=African swine fever virus TaxID=10497 RepID=A0A894KTQ6_ASF|nr:p285L [African swine fever virus]
MISVIRLESYAGLLWRTACNTRVPVTRICSLKPRMVILTSMQSWSTRFLCCIMPAPTLMWHCRTKGFISVLYGAIYDVGNPYQDYSNQNHLLKK